MKKHLRVGYFKTKLTIGLLATLAVGVMGGQALAADCTTCHTMPPTDAVAPSFRNITTGAVKGSHQQHMGANAPAADCAKCHNNGSSPTTYQTNHAAVGNFVIQMSTNINASPSGNATYAKGVFFNQTSMPVMSTCSNVNCHFGTTTPTWGSAKFAYTSATANDCNKCHSSTGTGTGAAIGTLSGGSHPAHTSTTTLDVTGCSKCHPTYTTFQHATSAGQRTIKIAISAGGTYTGGNMNYLPGQTGRTFGTCSNTYCHGTAPTPVWGGTLTGGCEACHKASTATGGLPAGHTIHIDPTVAAPGTGSYTNAAADNSTASAYNFSCASCHGNNINNHANGAANTNGAAGIQFQYSTLGKSPAYNYGTTALTDGNGFKYSNGGGSTSCNATYCHSNGQGGTGTSITWTTAAAGNCNMCHGNNTNPTALSGAHSKHIGNAATGGNFACADCHARTITNTDNRTLANKANHVNKFIDYSGANAGKAVVAYGSHVSCSNFYCHSDGKGNYTNPPAWTSGTTLGCNGCHGTASTNGMPSTGNHSQHISAGAGCQNCHANTTTTGTTITGAGHISRTVDVNPGGTFASGGSVNFSGTTTCSSITCHGAGKFTPATATWGGTMNCDGCHPLASLSGAHQRHMGLLTATTVTFYSYTANKSFGAETSPVKYGFGCATCHPVNAANHLNGTVDIELNAVTGAGTMKQKTTTATVNGTVGTATVTCTATYCHGDGKNNTGTTPAWNGAFANADRCANCHGNSPTTAAHSAHVVGIHYDDIYNGTSGLLPAAGAQAINAGHGAGNRSTTLNCNICHNATVTSAANDKATTCSTAACHGTGGVAKGNAAIQYLQNHVNGRVDVQFANVAVSSKAQLRDGSFAGYTAAGNGSWQRNRGYKNYTSSYDVTKTTLFNTASFTSGTSTCSNVACHGGKSVVWTQTLTCQDCHSSL